MNGTSPAAASHASRGVERPGSQPAGAPGTGPGGYAYEPLPAAPPPMDGGGNFGGQPYEGASFQMTPPSGLSAGKISGPYGAGYGPNQGQLPQSASHAAPPTTQGPGLMPYGGMQVPEQRSRSLAGPNTRTLSP